MYMFVMFNGRVKGQLAMTCCDTNLAELGEKKQINKKTTWAF